jgi:phosphatidylserine decarboxylase
MGVFALACFALWFFRDPERVHTTQAGAVVSPADGRIIAIGRVPAAPLGLAPAVKVSIFMSPLDVHVNRAPVEGRVGELRYVPGRFLNASLDKAAEANERLHLSLVLADGGRVELTQVAGFIARRIVCWTRPGDELAAGERFGMIRFGSRVDLYLPLETELFARPGERVRAGETILGRLG